MKRNGYTNKQENKKTKHKRAMICLKSARYSDKGLRQWK